MQLELKNKTNNKLILITLVVLEIIACYFAFYTLGEVKQFFYVLIFALNLIPLLLYFFRKKRASFLVGLIIALLLIPYQIYLVVQWSKLKKESSTIVQYIYDYQKDKGEFPQNISEYEFKNHNLIDHFSYNTSSKGFGLHYYVGTKGTTHFFYHSVRKWEYYPD